MQKKMSKWHAITTALASTDLFTKIKWGVYVVGVVVALIGIGTGATRSSYLASVQMENSTFATTDWTAPLSVATTAESSPTTNPTPTIQYTADEDPSLSGQTGIDSVSLYYQYRPYTSAVFGGATLLQTDTMAGTCRNIPGATMPFKPQSVPATAVVLNTSALSGNGVYRVYSVATDCTGNVEADPIVADVELEVDNSPPPTPTLVSPADTAAVQGASLQLDWSDEVDTDGAHPPVSYRYQVDGDSAFGSPDQDVVVSTSNSGIGMNNFAASGTYYWRVLACDVLNNCSVWSASRSFTIDNTAPITSVTVTNSPTKDVENVILNGGFESSSTVLTNWTAVGNVTVQTTDVLGGGPKSGSNMARVGASGGGSGGAVDVNILSQTIPNDGSGLGSGLRSVGFWYNFMTREDSLSGFDEPGLMVFVGDKMVHQVWASDIASYDGNSATVESTGWTYLSIDISGMTNPTLSLAFYAGNSGDNNNNSFLYLDDVSTNEAAVSSSAVFTLNATDNVGLGTVHYAYSLDGAPGDEVTGNGPTGTTFSIPSQPNDGTAANDGKVSYWSVDAAGNVEAAKTFHVSIDNVAPAAITDLAAAADVDNDGNFTLTWTAPSDTNPYSIDRAAEYQIRYSTTALDPAMSDAVWDALPTPIIRNSDGLPGGGARAPLAAGRGETYSVHVNGGANTYWFGIRSLDRALNRSGFDPAVPLGDTDGGSIASNGVATGPTVTTKVGDVVINEVMWMGSYGTAGANNNGDEWVELRNMTDTDIDISGWTIENLGTNASPTYTVPASTTIKANGYLVISALAYTDAGSALKNATDLVFANMTLANNSAGGEGLTLKDSSGTITVDQTTAPWPAGVNNTGTFTRRSMERTNVPGDGTVATNWHACNSTACASARSLYWDDPTLEDYGTPGGANLSLSEIQLETTLDLTYPKPEELVVSFTNVQAFNQVEMDVTYVHDVDGIAVTEQIHDAETFPIESRSWATKSLYLGTCSSGGVCASHMPVRDIQISLKLSGPMGVERTMERSITGEVTSHTVLSRLDLEDTGTEGATP